MSARRGWFKCLLTSPHPQPLLLLQPLFAPRVLLLLPPSREVLSQAFDVGKEAVEKLLTSQQGAAFVKLSKEDEEGLRRVVAHQMQQQVHQDYSHCGTPEHPSPSVEDLPPHEAVASFCWCIHKEASSMFTEFKMTRPWF